MNKGMLGILLLGSAVISVNQSSHAAVPSVKASKSSSFSLIKGHIVVQGGAFWSIQGRTQNIAIVDLIGDQFIVSKHNDVNGLAGLGYLVDGPDVRRVQMSYGLNAFYLPNASVSGIIFQEDTFANLSYRYQITHYPLYAVAKAGVPFMHGKSALTFDVGIGPNFMSLNNIKESSLDGGITIPDNIFRSNMMTTFSATAGVGIQLKNVVGSVPVECGYRFFYLGKGHFKTRTDQVLNNLQTGTAYANALVCGIRI